VVGNQASILGAAVVAPFAILFVLSADQHWRDEFQRELPEDNDLDRASFDVRLGEGEKLRLRLRTIERLRERAIGLPLAAGLLSFVRIGSLSLWSRVSLLDDEDEDEKDELRLFDWTFLTLPRDDEVEALPADVLLFVRRLTGLLDLDLDDDDDDELTEESEAEDDVDGDLLRLFSGAAKSSFAFLILPFLSASRFDRIESAVPFL
jgi:hypothetical protein